MGGLSWILLLLVLAGAAVGFVLWRQRNADIDLSSDDRFSAAEAISPAHARLLEYLQFAFPGQVVLFRPQLSQLVSVRVASNRVQMQKWLESHVVDFVVCTTDGRPEFAFDLRERSANVDAQTKRLAAMKARVLKTADVKLMRMHRSVTELPPADEFRKRLLDSINMGFSATPRRSSHSAAAASRSGPATAPSDLASLTDIMGLPPDSGHSR